MQAGFAVVCIVLIARDWYKDRSIMEFQTKQQEKLFEMQAEQNKVNSKVAESVSRQTSAIEKLTLIIDQSNK